MSGRHVRSERQPKGLAARARASEPDRLDWPNDVEEMRRAERLRGVANWWQGKIGGAVAIRCGDGDLQAFCDDAGADYERARPSTSATGRSAASRTMCDGSPAFARSMSANAVHSRPAIAPLAHVTRRSRSPRVSGHLALATLPAVALRRDLLRARSLRRAPPF